MSESATSFTRRGFTRSIAGGFATAAASPAATPNPGEDGDFFYRPRGAWAADFIPFYSDGRFHLFYLLDWRDRAGHGEGTPWFQISTADLVTFTEHGEMLARGSADEQDLYVFTGSVIEGEGQRHIFYTGHNPHLRKAGKPEQAVMHAVSSDLLHWKKISEDTFFAPAGEYEPHDWRDPFVFWNGEAKEYWMLLAARRKTGPSRRRGCTALCASTDLRKWRVREPFYAPDLYFTHECPDLFRMGDWWYLLFSEFSDHHLTRYRMSRTLAGPWIAPAVDSFDCRTFYAAKTASDGSRRYLFGWNPTRTNQKDDGAWNWGGNLVAHELIQNADGTLSVTTPAAVRKAFQQPVKAVFRPLVGEAKVGSGSVSIEAPGRFACATAGPMPDRAMFEAEIRFRRGSRALGLMARTSADGESGYYIRLEPGRGRLVFDSWPRPGDVPFMPGLERPLDLAPDSPVRLRVFVDGSVCVIYACDRAAMNTRLYNMPAGEWGVFVEDGAAVFSRVEAFLR
ncbi:MAG: DUF4975 domain-containing protein [Bryobacteraceae bacterium]|nr:DUF4975 domain-containing protein [Bryobacteraceae bacterium]